MNDNLDQHGTDSAEPVFILCCARSGSTLLRYILDSHPAVCCPPELHLGGLAQRLYWTYGFSAGLEPSTPDHERNLAVRGQVRENISGIMRAYAQRLGKPVWCEKSVYTIDYIDFIYHTFPNARYICLYRNCLDQVWSALETLESDPSGRNYGLSGFLAQTPRNRIDGLVDYWCAKTSAILQFQQARPGNCFALKYETIVEHTDAGMRELFEFLRLEWNSELIHSVFTSPHEAGPGDTKIAGKTGIESTSVGKGLNIHRHDISPDRLDAMNRLLTALGYPAAHQD